MSFTEGNNRNIVSLELTSIEGSFTLWSLGLHPVKQGAHIPRANCNCSNINLNLFLSCSSTARVGTLANRGVLAKLG